MTQRDTLRIGLIGCGRVVSYGHGPALRTVDGVQLVAVADITAAHREIAREWFGLDDANIYADHRDLLVRPDIEAVIIAAPPRARVQLIQDALAAGKHVLTEKPLAPNAAVAANMIATAEQAGLTFAICHNYLFHNDFRLLKKLLDDETIGKVHVLTMHFLGCQDNSVASAFKPYWRKSSDHAGGGILMDMLHAVYLAEWLLDGTAQQVMAFVDTQNFGTEALNVEDLALLQVAFPHSYASIQLAWSNGVGGVDVSGSLGHIRMRQANYGVPGSDAPGELYAIRNSARTDYSLPPVDGDWWDAVGDTFRGILRDFRAAIREGRAPIAPAARGYSALQVVLGAYASAATGRTISLPLSADNPVYQRGIDGVPDLHVWADSRVKRAGIFGLKP